MSPTPLVIIAVVVSAVALTTSLVALGRTNMPIGNFIGGYLLAVTPSGTLHETTIKPDELTTFMGLATVQQSVSVLTTGAAALNVTASVVRHGRQRDWRISTTIPGVVTAVNQTLFINLTGTDVLVPSDMPLVPNDIDYYAITARYLVAELDRDHVGTLFVFPSNSSMIFYPTLIKSPRRINFYPLIPSPLGFTSFHFNRTISVSAAFTWFAAA